MNDENLKSLGDRPEKERKQIASAGGKQSAKIRKKRKMMQDIMKDILDENISKKNIIPAKVERTAKALNVNIDMKTAICIAQVLKAVKGDLSAATFVRDLIGEAPINKQMVSEDNYEDFIKKTRGEER